MKLDHEALMHRCLLLAQKGAGKVAPNPMVGAVVVHNGSIIGEGYHRKYGEAHAEVNAIAAVRAKDLLRESTLFVSLEPCSHHGKTPPCADLIIRSGIPRVVIAQADPNPLVSGKGIEKLRSAGIEVLTGVLEKEARHLNRRFNTFHVSKRPYIILKWAQSADGFMDRKRAAGVESGPYWISHPATKKLVHKWRSEEQALLVGAGTINNDNPELTTREYAGRNPLRVVISGSGSVNTEARVFNDGLSTILFTTREVHLPGEAVEVITETAQPLLMVALEKLAARGISSVLVEGGRHTLQSFIDAGWWDEARIITSPSAMPAGMGGSRAPRVEGHESEVFDFAGDRISIIIPARR